MIIVDPSKIAQPFVDEINAAIEAIMSEELILLPIAISLIMYAIKLINTILSPSYFYEYTNESKEYENEEVDTSNEYGNEELEEYEEDDIEEITYDLRRCEYCGLELYDNERVCPNCGAPYQI